MEIRFEEEGHVEGRRGFCKVEVIFIPEENRKWSFFLQHSEEASLLGAEEACWAEWRS